MSQHDWRIPDYKHELASPSLSNSIDSRNSPLFSVWTAEQQAEKIDHDDDDLDTPGDDSLVLDTTGEEHSNPFEPSSENPEISLFQDTVSPLLLSTQPTFLQPIPEISTQPAPFGFLTFPMETLIAEDYQIALDPQPRNNPLEHNQIFTTQSSPLIDGSSTVHDESVTSYTPNAKLSSSRGMTRSDRIETSLNILRQGRINPVEFLMELVDVRNPKSAHFRGKLYSKMDKRLDELLDKIVQDPKGKAAIEDWFCKRSLRELPDAVEKENESPRKAREGNSRHYRPY
ncbi:hypothetical protein GYMLUDRAFT_34705, partial [Collybiopsis luxurians FD-317 M1]